jgi:hypothetical protein
MEINPKIREILYEFHIPYDDGLSYLLSIHFDCRPSYVPPALVQKMNITRILSIEDRKLVWLVPLFLDVKEEANEKWAWVKEWRELFKRASPLRAGNTNTCIARMKTFFAENPEVRTEEIFGATKMYIRNVKAATYVKTSHKFIYDGAGKSRNSELEEWVERYRLVMKDIQGVMNSSEEPVSKRDILQ